MAAGAAPAAHRLVSVGRPGPQPVVESDIELLTRCRSADADAWDQLVRRYERLVFSVALYNGLGVEDAADVCQGTFLALLESIERVHAQQGLASWLMTVARRHAWRLRRRRERELPVAALPDRGVEPLAGWESVAVVHQALHEMPEPCRELLIALYFDPAAPSYAEVARRLGRSIGGIGPLRGRCLQRMRAAIGEDVRT